jgi:orotate phosphoribosyltransferase
MTASALTESKPRLLELLRKKSVFHGEFLLASGARSSFYFDCRLTTLDPDGAVLVGQAMFEMIHDHASRNHLRIDAVGGLTLGADPVALAIAIHSKLSGAATKLQVFSVRKSPKAHGQHKLIEGNFKSGDHVVIIEDVVTRGDSALAAIQAVEQAGGRVELVAVLVEREEGGRQKLESRGYKVLSLFRGKDILGEGEQSQVDRGA